MTKAVKTVDIVAIVPARGGSKRLPRKNVLPLAGKPLIQWTLDAAKESGVIDLIAVTSDDDEVLAIAKQNQVMTIRRPDYLATDTATSVDAVLHALKALEEQGITAKRIMLLQPTSPLRNAGDIKRAVSAHDIDIKRNVVTVCEVEHPTAWSGKLADDSTLVGVDLSVLRSQDAEKEYRLNGSIYMASVKTFLLKKRLVGQQSIAVTMSRERSVDIDELIDFYFCELLIQKQCLSSPE